MLQYLRRLYMQFLALLLFCYWVFSHFLVVISLNCSQFNTTVKSKDIGEEEQGN